MSDLDLSTFGAAVAAATDLLVRAGVSEDRAALTARCIVTADAWGIASHGLMRLPYYLERIAAGGVNPAAELRVRSDSGPLLVLDGDNGLGHWQLWKAAHEARDRAAEYGVAVVAVGASSHCGAVGVYAWPALDAGMVSILFSNGPAVMPPWGGGRPLLSTSPIAAGIPTSPHPTIVDLATSAVARGRIATAAQSGSLLPDGWAFDADGRPTTDPTVALRGMLAPLGGAKGYALALLVEALTGGLVGPSLAPDVPDMFSTKQADHPQRIAHLVIMLDPARFGAVDGVDSKARLDKLADRVAAAGGRLPGAARVAPTRIPDETPLTVADAVRDALRRVAV